MGKPEFVDTHVHFYDMHHPELVYAHWGPDVDHPTLGKQMRKLGERNFVAEDYIEVTRTSNVVKAVHVQAAIGSPDPVKETEWLQEAADRTGFPHGIIAFANLSAPDVETVLAGHCEYASMRGIRDFDSAGHLTDSRFLHGFGLLEKYDLVAGMNVTWEQMDTVRSMADSHPNIRMVIDHTGGRGERDPAYLESWRRGMATVAGADNVWCKISGLGMTDHDWTVDSIRPFVLYCIETFGTERCFFGTNWPVDSLWSGYADVVDAYTEIVSEFSPDERERPVRQERGATIPHLTGRTCRPSLSSPAEGESRTPVPARSPYARTCPVQAPYRASCAARRQRRSDHVKDGCTPRRAPCRSLDLDAPAIRR